MKRILIDTAHGNRIHDIVEPGKEFETVDTLIWVDAADDVGPDTHIYENDIFKLKPAPPAAPPKPIPEPGAAGVARDLIDLGVKKGDGTPLVVTDFSQPIQDVLKKPLAPS